jgi:hypothetical protein
LAGVNAPWREPKHGQAERLAVTPTAKPIHTARRPNHLANSRYSKTKELHHPFMDDLVLKTGNEAPHL